MEKNLKQLVILLPCYSLEDLSLDRDEREAEEILSGWSALFHPVLLARAGTAPKWDRADVPPPSPADSLIVVPACSQASLTDEWLEQAREAGTILICGQADREEIVASVLDQLDEPAATVDPLLVDEFFALGFCHLQVELLTRQLRYMSNLDEVTFERKATAAAEKALEGDADSARQHLGAAFDLLTEAREYFYPVETHLLDLTLVAPTTLGESLRAELEAPGTTNLLISGESVQQMALREPATLAALKKALGENRAALVGGEFEEHELTLLDHQAIVAQFERGQNSYERYLDARPGIFGRRRFGLSPVLPQILRRLGFDGALHFTLDGGRFPSGNQSKIRWQGPDGSTIGAVGRLPVDASRARSFLNLPQRLGDVMDLDHTATAVFAHWPGQASRWYADLRRMAGFSPALGRFLRITDYFHTTEHSGQTVRYKADQYRSPYLGQAVAQGQRDPISRWVRYFVRRRAAEAEAALVALAELAGGRRPQSPPDENLFAAVEDACSDPTQVAAGLDDRIGRRIDSAMARLASALPRGSGRSETGRLVANPTSFPRCYLIDVSPLAHPPDVKPPIERVGDVAGRTHAVVEVPPMGFAWIAAGSGEPPPPPAAKKRLWKKPKPAPPMAEENRLRNEFFEIAFNPTTGAIQAIHDYASRENKLAQQIAFRFPHPGRGRWAEGDEELPYSVMAADRITITSAGPMVAEMECRGRLLDREGRQGARFVQTTRVRRGSRVIELDIDLDVGQQPGENPWDSYYAARFAWGDSTVDMFRGVSQTVQPTEAARIEAPGFLELRAEKGRTTILTGGLPYHRRFGLRKLDTLLVVRGETARSFRLGIGIDLPNPVTAAADFVLPRPELEEHAAAPSPGYGWLFHVNSRSVIATDWSSVFSGGRLVGFRTRLLETEGKRVKASLRAFRPLASARKTDLAGAHPEELPVDGDQVKIDLPPCGWVPIEVRFAETRS